MKFKNKLKYRAYLLSPEWLTIKIDIIQQRGCKCEKCGKKGKPNELHLHHKTYDRLYNELATDLQLLCPPCHKGVHGMIKGVRKNKKSSKPDRKPLTQIQKVKRWNILGRYKTNRIYLMAKERAELQDLINVEKSKTKLIHPQDKRAFYSVLKENRENKSRS